MGVKVLQCFPWSRNSKERGKSRKASIQTDTPLQEERSHPRIAPAWDSMVAQTRSQEIRHVCLTHKACICLRHWMDSNVIDATN